MEKFRNVFYGILSAFLLMHLLFVGMSIAIDHFFSGDAVFTNNNTFVRTVALTLILFSILIVYTAYVRRRSIPPLLFWVMFIGNSAITVYLAYSKRFVDASFSTLNEISISTSFMVWVMLILLGTLNRSVLNNDATLIFKNNHPAL